MGLNEAQLFATTVFRVERRGYVGGSFFAIEDYRDAIAQDDFDGAVRKEDGGEEESGGEVGGEIGV